MMYTLLLGSMMDEIVRRLIIYPDPALYIVLDELNGKDELVAHAASLVWLRIMYPDTAFPEKLPKGAKLLAKWSMPSRPSPDRKGILVDASGSNIESVT